MMQISCAVVCYQNSPQQITGLLSSLIASTDSMSLRLSVAVIDNSPHNRLAEAVQKFGVAYVHLPSNPGFGKAHNLAINNALAMQTPYHLILNPDTNFSSDVITTLVNFMERHKDVGLVMPSIRYPDGRPQYLCKLLPTPVDLSMRRFFPRLYELCGLLARYELHQSGYDKVMDVPSLSGCFMLIRTSVLHEVGCFDERFFMYLEDVDLSRRIGKVARTVFFPHVSITHEYVKGSYKNWKLLFNHVRSAILYFNKWGWFFDPERKAINRRALQEIESIKTSIELQ